MRTFQVPTQSPTVADPLVVDAAELHAIKLYAAMRRVHFDFEQRWKIFRTVRHKRIGMEGKVQSLRNLLAQPVPASEPVLRLEKWQLEGCLADLGVLENSELGRRLTQQTALVKLLSAYDERYAVAKDCLQALQAEAGKRFVGLFYPPLACLAAA